MSLDFALDFGSSFTRVADASGSVVFAEPTIAAVDEDSGQMVAFGVAATGLGANCAGRIRLHRPVHHGLLVDLDLVEQVLSFVLDHVGVSRLSRSRVVVSSHIAVTAVQSRAYERALKRAGARQVLFVEQPLACAIAHGLVVDEPVGQMVVDIGGGTTDAAILSLGGIASATSIAIGIDDFDDALRDIVSRTDRLVVDRQVAAQVRAHLPEILAPGADKGLEVIGRDQTTGERRNLVLGRLVLQAALDTLIEPIVYTVTACIREAPPELANDLLGSGLMLTGGGAHLHEIDRRLERATGVPVHVSNDDGSLAVVGAARVLASGTVTARALAIVGPR